MIKLYKMENNEAFCLPKVLAMSISTWHKNSGIHTQTDLFKFWDADKVAQIYLKANYPDTTVCKRFFRISETEIIKSVLTRKPVGNAVSNQETVDEKTTRAIKSEAKLYSWAHKKKKWFPTIMRELVWACGCWRTTALDDFVKNFSPDVYFVPIYPVVYTGWIQLRVLKRFPKPYVCFLTDDNYSYKACGKNIWAWIHRWMLRKVVRKLATNCTEMFTITQIEGDETDRDFGTNSVVLTKGIDYSNLRFDEQEPHTPIRMVYTGNLLIGRAASLVEISKALVLINATKDRVVLDIYTPTFLDKKTTKILNSNGCRLHRSVPKEEVAQIQKNADIVVFVESLEKEHRYDARLSFSTKLTDYFASGKCIFAIGDKDIAPIKYLQQYDCAVTCTDYQDVTSQLKTLIDTPKLITEYGKRAFEIGKQNHEESKVRETFISTICRAANKNGK